MDIPLLEQLARLLTQGRREAQRLVDLSRGRYRERAVLRECVRGMGDATSAPNRLLCGEPILSLAVLLSEHSLGKPVDVVRVDLHPARDDEPALARFARWIPRLCLLQALAPEAAGHVRAPREDHPVLRLVLDAAWPHAIIDDAAAHAVASHDASPTTLLLAEDTTRLLALLPSHAGAGWIACAPGADVAARVRRALLASGQALDVEDVGTVPRAWMRRHVGARPVDAMHAALAAFGAKPLAQANAGTTRTGRRRAGMEVLLGECLRDGLRTLVWVDAPDRCTSDATLCRAITRRELDAARWDRVVVLGWQFAATFAQHLALRSDGRIEARVIRKLPRNARRAACIDPDGFHAVRGLSAAWVDRERSLGAPEHEWVTVQLRDAVDVADWSIDPDHDGEVFRGRWHASRDGHAGLRGARLRVAWRAGPRRVCVRAFAADGVISDVVVTVRHRADAGCGAPPRAAPRGQAHARAEALC